MLRMRADEPLTMVTELPLAPLSTKLFPSVMVSMSLNTLPTVTCAREIIASSFVVNSTEDASLEILPAVKSSNLSRD